jgi:hypothetical protein
MFGFDSMGPALDRCRVISDVPNASLARFEGWGELTSRGFLALAGALRVRISANSERNLLRFPPALSVAGRVELFAIKDRVPADGAGIKK